MKKKRLLSLMFIACLFYTAASSQISKGTITIQGEAGIGYQWAGLQSPEGLFLSWNPGFGLMLTDRIMVGGTFGGASSSVEEIGTDAFFQPFVRYYFNPSSSQNLYFISGNIGIPVGSNLPLAGSVTAGLNRFITPSLALEGTINYTLIELNENQISAGLGLRVFLSREDRQNENGISVAPTAGSLLLGSSNFRLGFTDDSFQIGLAPNIGYFITEKLVIGGQFNTGYLTGGTSTRNFNSYSLQFQPFSRYYFLQSGRWHWFAEMGGGIRYVKTTQEDLWNYRSRNFFTYGKAGTNLFIAPSIALEFGISLNHNFDANVEARWNQDVIQTPEVFGRTDTHTTLLSFDIGLQFFIFKDKDKN